MRAYILKRILLMIPTLIGISFVTLDAPRADAKIQKLEAFLRSHPGASLMKCERDILDPAEYGDDDGPEIEWEKY